VPIYLVTIDWFAKEKKILMPSKGRNDGESKINKATNKMGKMGKRRAENVGTKPTPW
jgi:hypothetical protein